MNALFSHISIRYAIEKPGHIRVDGTEQVRWTHFRSHFTRASLDCSASRNRLASTLTNTILYIVRSSCWSNQAPTPHETISIGIVVTARPKGQSTVAQVQTHDWCIVGVARSVMRSNVPRHVLLALWIVSSALATTPSVDTHATKGVVVDMYGMYSFIGDGSQRQRRVRIDRDFQLCFDGPRE